MVKFDRNHQYNLSDFNQPIGLKEKKHSYSDRELAWQITENPYYQFFIGLPGYQDSPPFVPSLLVEFRKRLTDDARSTR